MRPDSRPDPEGSKIRHDELVEIFGDTMPIKAASTIAGWTGTADDLRARLRGMAPSRTDEDLSLAKDALAAFTELVAEHGITLRGSESQIVELGIPAIIARVIARERAGVSTSSAEIAEILAASDEVAAAFGPPGDHGHETREGRALSKLYLASSQLAGAKAKIPSHIAEPTS